MSLPVLILKKREDRRLRAGHLWVFSNEVDTSRCDLSAFQPGDPVEIRAYGGRFIGYGYVNPHSLICARIMSRDGRCQPGVSLLVERCRLARSLREKLYPDPFYRLIFGESDNLPGLVVDRYGGVLVVQITTAGMERMKGDLIEALTHVFRPAGILLRNDTPARALEGLPSYVETALGEVPEHVEIMESGLRFRVPLAAGQKTGWFFDQRDNRARLGRYVRGMSVLDAFSYVGGWGVRAAASGARAVTCIDSSAAALDLARQNAADNNVSVETRKADAFVALKTLHDAGERFDVVILDPPAFVKRRKALEKGKAAYQRLNQLAMQIMARDGVLVSASCSYHLRLDDLVQAIQRAARHLGREIQVLEIGGQGADHPVHPAIPETAYLKAVFMRVVDA